MEDSKSDNQMKRKDDNKKIAFKQFDFKTYNNYKEYPLYHILAKKKMADNCEANYSATIVKNSEGLAEENRLQHDSEAQVENQPNENSK